MTTNSQNGVLDIEQYYPVFKAMEIHGLILNLHGEMQSSPPAAFAAADTELPVTVLNAERLFVPQLYKLHRAFPKLRIILEHVSSREGIAAVRQCGSTVCRALANPTTSGTTDISPGGRDHYSTSPLEYCGRLVWGCFQLL